MKFFRRYFCMYAEPSRAAREEKSYVSCYSQWPKYWQRLKVERPYKMAVSSTDDWDKSSSKFGRATWRYSLCRRRAGLALALGAGTNTTWQHFTISGSTRCTSGELLACKISAAGRGAASVVAVAAGGGDWGVWPAPAQPPPAPRLITQIKFI